MFVSHFKEQKIHLSMKIKQRFYFILALSSIGYRTAKNKLI